jgi:hypothetical protein
LPYPLELIPFQPLDGANNRYGQLNKIIGDHPFKEAVLEGFDPPQPFAAPTHSAQCGDYKDFHWPTLAELNDPFPWLDDKECRQALKSDDDHVIQDLVLYTGLPPTPAAYQPPRIPPTSLLVASIIKSSEKLFFIAHSYNHPMTREWHLIRVAFKASTTLSPSCLQDRRFLVEFFTLHHVDIWYNAINQCFWLQYHAASDIATPTPYATTHLIRPSNTSKTYAKHHGLVPFRRWINVTHSDTFIHGPFDFADVQARKTRDRISQANWDILSKNQPLYVNSPPRFDHPSYSIHVDQNFHVAHLNTSCTQLLMAAAADNTHGESLDDKRLW